MTSSYEWHIKMCKKPKKPAKVKRIIAYLLIGIRKEYPTSYMAARLNQYGVWTLMSRSWTPYSLQMQLLKMQRMDTNSSLAWGLADALRCGDASQEDIDKLTTRVEHWTH
jgi:hypothetical protein